MFGNAVFFYRFVMSAGAISFMFFKAVLREFFAEFHHSRVTRDFCHNRRKRNDKLFFIPFYNSLLVFIARWRAKPPIKEDQ